MPNVDIAVIALDDAGRVDEAANVLLSRDVPNGLQVKIDDGSLSARNVQFRAWNIDRWNGVVPWSGQSAEVALNAPRDRRAVDFMAPYSASLFKIMVAWQVMRAVDAGKLSLDDTVSSAPAPLPGLCSSGTDTIRDWMDAMITESSNEATCVLLHRLHQLGGAQHAAGERDRSGNGRQLEPRPNPHVCARHRKAVLGDRRREGNAVAGSERNQGDVVVAVCFVTFVSEGSLG